MLREESWRELCRGEGKAGGGRELGWNESTVLAKKVLRRKPLEGIAKDQEWALAWGRDGRLWGREQSECRGQDRVKARGWCTGRQGKRWASKVDGP